MQQEMTRGMSLLYGVAAALALGAALITFVLTEHTADYWSWAISPPISAAFLGGCYLAALTLLGMLSRAETWAEGQLAVAPVMAISLLLLATTLIYWDRFDQSHVVFWFWLAAYVVVPPLLLVLLDRQLKTPGQRYGSGDPIPALPRLGLAAHTGIMLGIGALMLVAPGYVEGFWPWQLSDLTSRALGSFVLGFGLAALVVLRVNDLALTRAPGITYAVLGAAELIAVARYADDVDMGAAGIIYVLFLASMVVGGLMMLSLASASASSPQTRLPSGH